MNISHIDLGPIIYGFLLFFPILMLGWKIKTGKWLQVGLDIFSVWALMSMHGASTHGRMSAIIAAMMCSMFLPYLFPKSWRS